VSILAGMTEKAKGLISYLRGAVARGWSSNRIIERARELGLPTYRRSEMLRDIRILRGEAEVAERMKYVRRDAVISERLYLPSKTYLPTRYVTTVELRGFDLETGESFRKHVTLAHDTLRRREELEDIAMEIALDESPTLMIEEALPVMGRYWV